MAAAGIPQRSVRIAAIETSAMRRYFAVLVPHF
jgi:hypothetical protein